MNEKIHDHIEEEKTEKNNDKNNSLDEFKRKKEEYENFLRNYWSQEIKGKREKGISL